MQSLNSHIAYLLSKHECLVLPGFGALVIQYVEAISNKEEGVFIPSVYTIGFNQDLKYNDGLLAGLLMKEHRISYNEAIFLVHQFIERLKESLKSQRKVEIPMVGSFSLSSENILFFQSVQAITHLSSNASLFGFCNFHIPALTDIESSPELPVFTKKKSKDVLWIPVNKRFFKSIGSVVAASIFGILIFSTSLDNNSAPKQYANVISTFVVPVSGDKSVISTEVVSNNKSNNCELLSSPDTNNKLSDPVKNSIEKEKPSHNYYIIVGSFPNKSEADKKLSAIRSELSGNATILEGKQCRVRIYLTSFDNENDAELFVRDLRLTHPKYKDAWVLGQRNR